MVKASNSNKSVDFAIGSIATLRIPPKMRLNTESSRLPIRILKCQNGQYTVQSQYGKLRGRYPGTELNLVPNTANLGARILLEEVKNSIITLPKAVAKANNRASINAA